jgi:hypothetical protein
MKSALKKERFCVAIDSKNATEELKRFSQNGFKEFVNPLYSRRQKCVVAKRNYFEENIV